LLKRTSKKNINSILEKNINWNILDIGCGYRANKFANVIADVQDFENFYKEKKFVRIKGKVLPFRDKEFDYVITSHVIEHVDDFQFFIKELERISSKGYIELPTRLGDNLVYENQTDHIWWFYFNDDDNELIVAKKNQLLQPFINVSTAKLLEETFRDSLVIELSWEKNIDYKVDNKIRYEAVGKISFLKLIRKFISKKIRSIYK